MRRAGGQIVVFANGRQGMICGIFCEQYGRKVEEEFVLSVTEILNTADDDNTAWQKEFSPAYQSSDGELRSLLFASYILRPLALERLHLALLLISQYSPLLCDEIFGALSLPVCLHESTMKLGLNCVRSRQSPAPVCL